MVGTNILEFKSQDQSLSETITWLRLIRSENVGPMTFYSLLRQFGSAEAALEALPDLAKRGGRKQPINICSLAKATEDLKAHLSNDAVVILAKDPLYPQTLLSLCDAPPIISARGNVELLNSHCIGIVGARNASLNGKHFAHKLASELGQSRWTIVSGLARGIDTHAHQGALTAKTPTIAVVAGGVDNIYPQENTQLYQRIVEKGVIVSEMPFGVTPQSRHFPRRNRLISGLSEGVIIVEAANRSGSLITARYALDQGREVFAVPGSPFDPRCRGSNDLIRQGALLIQTSEDVNEMFKEKFPIISNPEQPKEADEMVLSDPFNQELSPIRKKILENLSPSPISIDLLARKCDVPAQEVLCALLELELAGKANRLPGNQVALVFSG